MSNCNKCKQRYIRGIESDKKSTLADITSSLEQFRRFLLTHHLLVLNNITCEVLHSETAGDYNECNDDNYEIYSCEQVIDDTKKNVQLHLFWNGKDISKKSFIKSL